MKTYLQIIFSFLILMLFSLPGSFAQTTPDCDNLIGPPVTDDMFNIPSACGARGDIFFTYSEFQASSNGVTHVLDIPIDTTIIDSTINQTSADNLIDVASSAYGNQSISDLMECFDVLCSPHLDSAQVNLDTLAYAFENANDITLQEAIDELTIFNQQNQTNVQIGELQDSIGDVTTFADSIAAALDGLDLQSLIANELGMNIDCSGASPWDDILPDENPFNGPGGGVGESFIKQMEEKVAESFASYLTGENELGGDPNWFLGEVEGLGQIASGTMMPSPSASSTIKSIQSGVNLYNGSGSLSLPLDVISNKDISVPISVSGSPGALKVDDQESLLGSNMNINAGGKITRVVNGLPDDFYGDMQGYSYGYKRGIKVVSEFTGINVGLDLRGRTPNWLKGILCRILQIIINDLLNFNINSGCSDTGLVGIINDINNNLISQGSTGGDASNALPTEIILKKKVEEENEVAKKKIAPKVTIRFFWEPDHARYINAQTIIKIPLFKKIDLVININFRAGVKIIDVPSPVVINKKGVGSDYLTSTDTMNSLGLGPLNINDFNTLSPEDKLQYLNQKHSTKKRSDAEFFNPRIYAFLEAMENLFDIFNTSENDPYPVYNTTQLDLESDEYYYDFGGYSGKFYIQPDGQNITLVPYQDFKVIVNRKRGDIDEFKFITPEGIEYTFRQKATSRYDHYSLPTFFKYPEKGNTWTRFKEPTIGKTEYPIYNFWIGLPVSFEIKKDYLTNYYVEIGQEYISAWHVTNIHSLISDETVTINYNERQINYNASKNWSHTFPNFNSQVIGGETLFNTDTNNELPFHIRPREWKNGFADLTYSMSEAFVTEPIVRSIYNNRDKEAVFYYDQDNLSLPGASLCTKIEIKKNNLFYKAWEFGYSTPNYTQVNISCGDTSTVSGGATGPVYSDLSEYQLLFDIPEKDENDKFVFRFPIVLSLLNDCIRFTFPVKFKFDIKDHAPSGYYYMDRVSEYGSLMHLKTLLSLKDNQETTRYQAEFVRNFLRTIKEIDGENGSHNIAKISYNGDLGLLPKRYSIHQDIWGYYNGISTSMSPFIKMSYGNELGLGSIGYNTDHFAFRHPDVSDQNFDAGRHWQADLNLAKIGQIDSVILETGAFLVYNYDLHQYPEISGNLLSEVAGGLRLSGLIKGSENGPSNVSNYIYHKPSIVNTPLFLDQYEKDRYYKDLEVKVKTGWKPLNTWQMNKGAYVGYGHVDEIFENNGRIEHYFTNPNLPGYEPLIPDTRNLYIKYHRRLRWEDNNYRTISETSPGYHSRFGPKISRDWRLGLENLTKVYSEDNQLLQSDSTIYSFAPMLGANHRLKYYKGDMYQYLHYGSYDDITDAGTLYQLTDAGTACFKNIIAQIIRFIIKHIHTEHPYRYIEKDFSYMEMVMESEKTEPLRSYRTNYYADGKNYATTYYAYYGNSERKTQRVSQFFTTDQSSNQQSTETDYIYADNLLSGTIYNFIDGAVMTEMDDKNYEIPIFQINKLNGTPVSGSASDFAKYGNRFLPESVWGIRQGEFVLTGRFTSYDPANGMPLEYRLAKYGTGYDVGMYNLFPVISMTWTPNLLPDTRTFEGFTTSNDYNDLCQLSSSTDANGLTTLYTYDPRRRLDTIVGPGGLQTQTFAYNMNPLQTTTTTTFSDGTTEQEQVETSDGWGNFLSLVRQDGAVLTSRSYDNLFRVIEESQLGSGSTKYRYEASPLSRVIETEDAVGNIFKTEYLGPNPSYPILVPYAGIKTTDPNGHVSKNWQDAFGKPVIRISGAGGITKTAYDTYGRVKQIVNPINEVYKYTYNKMGLLAIKEIPHKVPEQYWYDKSMRMVVKRDANATLLLDYDNAYRLKRIGRGGSVNYGDVIGTVLNEEAVNSDIQDDLLINNYEPGKTWIANTREAILKNGGVDGEKASVFSRDNLGRVIGTNINYTNGNSISELITSLNDANIPLGISRTVTGPDGTARSMDYTYTIDNVLRQINTSLDYEGQNTLLEKLVYNGADQVIQKMIGETATNGFLQTVDFTYDGAGKLLSINEPVETGCLLREEVCQLYWGNVESGIHFENENCGNFSGIRLDGIFYSPDNPIPLTDTEAIEAFIDEQIGIHGSVGATEVFYQNYFGVTEDFHISIMQTNVQSAIILFENNCTYILTSKDCCEIPIITQGGQIPLPTAPNNPDLFFEQITYNGLDIAMIEMLGSCSAGLIRNQYQYDGDHRVTKVDNTLWAPHKIEDAFSSSYSYDPAGNILSLQRNGWVALDEEFRKIDDLIYNYKTGPGGAGTTSLLESVSDQLASGDPIAQPAGFGKSNALSNYSYNANGSLIGDSGKSISAIGYNLLNLPEVIAHQTDGSISFEYTFGGEKIKKTTPDGERQYLGGLEYQDNGLELIHIPNGRITEKAGLQLYQYHLVDHLGNVVVLFEDKNDDGTISLEEESGSQDSEVIQRNFYYSFGLRVDAPHFLMNAEPRADFLYNGKENIEELDFNMLEYGFRLYDPAIGRFPSVDPIADNFAFVSGFNYAENSPIGHIDLWGLQKFVSPQLRGHIAERLPGDLVENHKAVSKASTFFGNMPDEASGIILETGAGFIPILGQGIDAYDTYNAFDNGDGWDITFALAAWIPGGDFLKSLRKGYKRLDAKVINKGFTDAGGKAPYDEAFDVIEGVTKEGDSFVRVHGKNNAARPWMMRASEIEGLSAQEIKDKFSIPELPTHISDVNVPAGTNIRVGVAAKVEGWGKGGGTQVEVLDRVQDDWITNTSKID